jgi:hypothetical protein
MAKVKDIIERVVGQFESSANPESLEISEPPPPDASQVALRELDTGQPTILREKTSSTKAT